MKGKIKDKQVEIFIAVVTVIVSVLLSIYAATYTLKQDTKKGEAVLQEVGFRYFFNFYRAFNPETGALKQDEITKRIYFDELRSILNTIDGLSANPAYLERSQKSANLPILASEVRAEISQGSVQRDFSIRISATLTMCRLYLEGTKSQIELPSQDGTAVDIRTFGERICSYLKENRQ